MSPKYANQQPEGSINRVKKIAIIGASGQIGQHITQQLLLKGRHTITVITRPGSTAKFPDGVEIERVDYMSEDTAALTSILCGKQAFVICLSARAPQDAIFKLIRAAADAGVQFILPNWWGHDPANGALLKDSMLAERADAVRRAIEELGVSSYILLASGFWYEFSLGGGPNRFGFDIKERSLIIFDGGETPMCTTTWPQCGRAVAEVLSLNILPGDENDDSPTLSQFANGPLYVSSFRLTQREMFNSILRVTETSEADWTISHEDSETRWRESSSQVRQGDWVAFTKMLYSRMWFPSGDGDYETAHGLANKALGLPVEEVDEATAVAVRMAEKGEVPYGH